MSDHENLPAQAPLSDVAAAMIDDYFDRLERAVRGTGAGPAADTGAGRGAARDHHIAADVLADLRAHVTDRLRDTPDTPDDVTRVLAELGTPEDLAAELAEQESDDSALDGDPEDRATPGAGSVLGIPYDLRPPTSERFASRWWNPLDRRILVPKVWGIGWVVNLGAIAVRTGIVHPDDEDVPFAAVPPRTVARTLWVPVIALGVFGLFAALSWSSLPTIVPNHWNAGGTVDGYASRGSNLALLSLIAVLPVAVAAWVHSRRRPPVNKVAASALSLAAVVLAIVILAQTLYAVHGGTGIWATWGGIGLFLLAPFLLFVRVSRIGRAEEQRRDLHDVSTKGHTR